MRTELIIIYIDVSYKSSAIAHRIDLNISLRNIPNVSQEIWFEIIIEICDIILPFMKNEEMITSALTISFKNLILEGMAWISSYQGETYTLH